MKRITSSWLILLMVVITLILVGTKLTLPTATVAAFPFEIGSDYDDNSEPFIVPVTQSGCILVQINSWSSASSIGTPASRLALMINGSDRTTAYARQDGSASAIEPLWASYAVSAQDIERVNKWTVSVSNFTRRGTATGYITVEYPPTRTPCELQATTSRIKERVDLNWRYTGSSFRGSFLVERSTDGRTWRVVKGCTTFPKTTVTAYSCSDTSLTSGTLYYYRVCAIASGSKCGTREVTPATRVRAP